MTSTTNREAKFRKSASRYYQLIQFGPRPGPTLFERFKSWVIAVRESLGRV